MTKSIGSMGVATFLLSRFNLYIPTFRDMAKLDASNYDEWCRNRVKLFLKYTLPSVSNQTKSGHFKWLIYFDVEINNAIAEVLLEIKKYPFIKAIHIDLRGKSVVKDWIDQVRSDINSAMPKGATYVSTTMRLQKPFWKICRISFIRSV
jgi:hypothetical protein